MEHAPGCVYLVGAGPGDPGLVTVRGAELVRQADVIVYDRLVNPALLKLARPECELVYMGKEGRGPSAAQREVAARLVEFGRRGRKVVRLKSGDPYVFGRGGEEALALAEAGIPFEVVPGITSVLAAAAYVGIPVTQRGLATTFTITTGHDHPDETESAIDWSALARSSHTVAFLMGIEHVEKICERLIAEGRRQDEPAALVRWATRSDQEVVLATLATMVGAAREAGIQPPAVLLVGQVVRLSEQLNWSARRPLHGRRVLVTRPREQADELSERLRALGAEAIETPTIRIAPLATFDALDDALRRLPEVDWVVFTSVNGVEATFERLDHLGLDARAFGRVRVAVIGPATERRVRLRGIRADFIPATYTSEEIVKQLGPRLERGSRVLLLRADLAPSHLATGLTARGADVQSVVAYRTLPDDGARTELPRVLRERRVHAVTFTSASTVRGLLAALDGEVELLGGALIAAIGPVTARAVEEAGLRVDAVARDYTIDGLIRALVERLVAERVSEPGGHP
ncbi:MAG: uroporphyrinogen-III C-methyltransferase [Chloroflexi bacterium]|nr:uroporphyrinogen-III C-methyltransferase [Chloroflexota bacterium]